jgi:hypothetical protein
MQVRADVGKIVDLDSEATGHGPKRIANGALVPAKRPRAPCPVARENDMHGAPDADGALELATAEPDGAAVLGSSELGMHAMREERSLHRRFEHSR